MANPYLFMKNADIIKRFPGFSSTSDASLAVSAAVRGDVAVEVDSAGLAQSLLVSCMYDNSIRKIDLGLTTVQDIYPTYDYLGTSRNPFGIAYDATTQQTITTMADAVSNQRVYIFNGTDPSDIANHFELPPKASDVRSLAVDHSTGGQDLVINVTGKKVFVMFGISATVKKELDFETMFPAPDTSFIEVEVDTEGNLLVLPWKDNSTPSNLWKMNGISTEIIDVVPFDQTFIFCAWAGDAIAYEPITGYPDIDAVVPVISGIWDNPSGPDTHGTYIQAIIQAIRELGYVGADRVAIIRAAAQSTVNN